MYAPHVDPAPPTDPQLDLQLCVEHARDALVALDAAGHVVVWSPAAERLYGWPAAEVLGQPLPWPADGPGGAHHRLHELARQGVALGTVPIPTPHRSGPLVTVEVGVDPVRVPDGTVIGSCSIHRCVPESAVTPAPTATTGAALDPVGRDARGPVQEVLDLVGAEQAEHRRATAPFDAVCDRYHLDTFERDLVALLLTGHRIPTMARTLYRSPGTIRNRLSHLYRKCGVHGQLELLELLRAELGELPGSRAVEAVSAP